VNSLDGLGGIGTHPVDLHTQLFELNLELQHPSHPLQVQARRSQIADVPDPFDVGL